MLVADIHRFLDERFPFADAAEWDPVGLQLGDMDHEAELVAVAHEVTDDVVESALSGGVATIVSYHPLLFDPVTAIVAGRAPSGRALRLLHSGISLLVVHTAMDAAPAGTGDALLTSFGIQTAGSFAETEDGSDCWIGRFGSLPQPTTASSLAELISKQLVAPVRIAGDPGSMLEVVAAVPGSGSSFIEEAAGLADAYVTGDVSHHGAQSAVDSGLVVLDAGHVPTERPGVESLYDAVRDVAPDAVFITSDPHPWEDVSWKT